MRESEEVERLRLALATPSSVSDGEPPELDQTCLVGMQLEAELRQSFTKVDEELLRFPVMLEPDNEVVGEAGDDHITASLASPPLPNPPVEDVVEIDVGQQRRR